MCCLSPPPLARSHYCCAYSLPGAILFLYSVKKLFTFSRKIKSLNDNKVHVCMSMWRFLGSFCAYCFTSDHISIIFPSSKQSALKWCLPWQGEPLTSCQEQTIEIKGFMSCVRELCHSFGYQLKLTGTIHVCEGCGGSISGKRWTAICRI